ncbi:FAD-binding oxidoreductase [Falsigemmobacter faecalis]|uniref:FAD-binding oxidoreductase n=1 Tax=Falsigemmobacter faecalis TaxID=2488730 RepID=A0A3P3D0I1_9RHOB|nr:FAD-binding oxidoreductase [Falsigemmobacter faecalis]RRH67960.1 FAD-binding oxidoreductase [Falsigemmobacter faecalis]
MSKVTIARRSLLKFAAAFSLATTGMTKWAIARDLSSAARPEALAAFTGEIITRGNPAYLSWFWAMTWYRSKVERYPAMFVQPLNKVDLALVVNYANDNGLRLTIRSSGHNITMPCLEADAIMIDMSRFDGIEIDGASKTGWVGPGALSEHINEKAFALGLSFPSAHTGFVTVGGFLLGGGMAWNMPAWGMGAGSILGAEVMLADGRVVMVSETENPDLYWAMRGVGPGFFVIVIQFHIQLYDAPVAVKNSYFIGLDNLETAVAECLRLLPASNNRTEVLGALGKFNPPGTPKEEETWHWVLTLMSFGKTHEDALEAARVFTESALPGLAKANPATNVPLTYMDMFSQLSTDGYSEFRTSEVALFTDEPAKALRTTLEFLSNEAVDARSFGFSVLGTNPTVPEPASFTYAAPHYLSWYLMGNGNEEVEKNNALMHKMHDALKPLIKGYYINEIDLNVFPDMARDCFSQEKWDKLVAVRKAYDPNRLFHSYLDRA